MVAKYVLFFDVRQSSVLPSGSKGADGAYCIAESLTETILPTSAERTTYSVVPIGLRRTPVVDDGGVESRTKFAA